MDFFFFKNAELVYARITYTFTGSVKTMGTSSSFLEWKGYVIAAVSFLISLILYFNYTLEFFYSLIGASFTAGLVWGSYLVIRMIFLAAKE